MVLKSYLESNVPEFYLKEGNILPNTPNLNYRTLLKPHKKIIITFIHSFIGNNLDGFYKIMFLHNISFDNIPSGKD